jgi:hypothetical protein
MSGLISDRLFSFKNLNNFSLNYIKKKFE